MYFEQLLSICLANRLVNHSSINDAYYVVRSRCTILDCKGVDAALIADVCGFIGCDITHNTMWSVLLGVALREDNEFFPHVDGVTVNINGKEYRIYCVL